MQKYMPLNSFQLFAKEWRETTKDVKEKLERLKTDVPIVCKEPNIKDGVKRIKV